MRETGRVASFTATYLKDPETGKVIERPIVCAQLDGADTSYPAQLDPDIEFKDTYIGMPIKVHWAEDIKGGLMDIEYYDPIEDNSKDLQPKED